MYGLSAGVWTEKGSRILWMADRLRAGVVWGNTFNRFDPASPFGGYKESGLRPRGRPARARGLPEVRMTSRPRQPAAVIGAKLVLLGAVAWGVWKVLRAEVGE